MTKMGTDYIVCVTPNCVLFPVFFSLFCFNVVFSVFFAIFLLAQIGQSGTGQSRTKHFKLAKVGLEPWPKSELAKVGRTRSFFPSSTTIFILSSSLGGLLRGFWWCFVAQLPSNVHIWRSRAVVCGCR